LDVEVVGTYSS